MSRKITSDEIAHYFDYGLHIPSRTIFIGSNGGKNDNGVDNDMSEKAIKGLHLLDQSQGDINIQLISCGGNVYDGLAIFDAIKKCKNQVNIYGTGEVMSAASFILQSGDKRILSPNARLMLHYGTVSVAEMHPNDHAAWSRQFKIDNKLMEDIYLEKIQAKIPEFTRRNLKDLIKFDCILTPDKAMELGLIDQIGEDE